MDFHYLLFRKEEEPSKPQPGFFWLKQSTGQMYFSVFGRWVTLVSGNPTNSKSGVFWKQVSKQSGQPPNPEAGKIWLDTDTGQEYVYIDGWIPLVGG